MLILIALIIGAAVGTTLHFVLPRRATRGTALGPVFATAVAGVTWTTLTWLGFAETNLWLWLAALVVPAAATWLTLGALGRSRSAHDEREKLRLRIA